MHFRTIALPFLFLSIFTCGAMLSGCESSTVNAEPDEPSLPDAEAMVYRPDANLAYNDPAVKQTFLDGVRLLYEERYDEARAVLRPLAEAGHTDAQLFMAHSYMPQDILKPNQTIPYDWQQGIPWLRRAADGGHAEAQWLLGEWYYRGRAGYVQRDYFKTDWDKVRHYLRAAAEQGLAVAQSTLAGLYKKQHGVPMNEAAWQAHNREYFPIAWMYYTLASERYPEHDGVGIDRKQLVLDLRAQLEARMTPEQIAEARRLTERWLRTHPDAYQVQTPPELYPPEIYD